MKKRQRGRYPCLNSTNDNNSFRRSLSICFFFQIVWASWTDTMTFSMPIYWVYVGCNKWSSFGCRWGRSPNACRYNFLIVVCKYYPLDSIQILITRRSRRWWWRGGFIKCVCAVLLFIEWTPMSPVKVPTDERSITSTTFFYRLILAVELQSHAAPSKIYSICLCFC